MLDSVAPLCHQCLNLSILRGDKKLAKSSSRYIAILVLVALYSWNIQPAKSESCRIAWKDYKNWVLSSGEHKAFAVTIPHYSSSCRWYHGPNVEFVSQHSLEECDKWQSNTCKIVDIDGIQKIKVLDFYFVKDPPAPVSIDIFDGVTKKLQKTKGYVLFEYPESGPSVGITLLSDSKKEICSGSYIPQGSSTNSTLHFASTVTCFRTFKYSVNVTPTGFRYVNGLKVGYSFDVIFNTGESYIHIISVEN